VTNDRPTQTESWEDFSLVEGGPLHRLARTVGFPGGLFGLVCLGLSIALLAWVPLLALAALTHTLTAGSTVPFLQSPGTHVRLLVAIPLLFVTEATFDRRVRHVIRTIVTSQIVPQRQLPRLCTALSRAQHWRDAGIIEATLVIITILLMWNGLRSDLPGGISTWRHTTGGQQTAAGWWYNVASLPIFQFLALRWFAHLLIWSHLLWRIRQLDLQLLPTHPDLAGGLGGFGGAHASLAPLNFAASGIIVATFAEEFLYAGTDMRRIALPLAVTVVGNTFILVAPLLMFAPRLFATKHRGSREYSELGTAYTRAFDVKWLRSDTPPTDPLLGSPDVQSLADLANAFDIIRRMRVLPIARHDVVFLLAAAALPAVPLILFVVPLDELIIHAARTLLHV
jgi:hypothetical protein